MSDEPDLDAIYRKALADGTLTKEEIERSFERFLDTPMAWITVAELKKLRRERGYALTLLRLVRAADEGQSDMDRDFELAGEIDEFLRETT